MRGHVGNGAARFALQRLGFDVWAVPTVLLSNHPGHGKFRGETVAAAQLGDVDRRPCGARMAEPMRGRDFRLSGRGGSGARGCRCGAAREGGAIPSALYLCDPVFGDDDGAYARAGVAEAMARDLLPLADIVTPNRFELSSLTSRRIESAEDAVAAARSWARPRSWQRPCRFRRGRIGTVVVTPGGAWATAAARLDGVPNGSGDLLAALYLAARLKADAPKDALARASSSVDCVLRASVAARADEMMLVARQADLAEPAQWLEAVAISTR